MLRIPLVLFGTSIGQVFFQRCAEKINKGQNVTDVAVKSVKTLLYISIVPFGIVFFFGSELFEIVFGPSWKESGVYAEIMVPWFMVNFLASPISTLPLILKKQRPFFVIALIDTILMIATLTIPKMFFNVGIIETLWLTSIVQAIFLLIVIFIIFDWARKWKKS
jgi:O-antigen/teichoic acid export membrane protein